MRGHSRSKNGVLSHAYDPRIHDDAPLSTSVLLSLRNGLMDCRVKPGNDIGEVGARLSGMAGTSPAMTGKCEAA
jgi:hypothetical protein